MSTPQLRRFSSEVELAAAAARAWLDEIERAKRAGQHHAVALSGGRIARHLFAATVEAARNRPVVLQHVHFFWADERCVPPDSPESNFRVAWELLLDPLSIPMNQIHRIQGEADPWEASKQASAEMRRCVASDGNGQPVLDLVFLGLGEDGHIASLFPGEPENLVADESVYRPIFNSPKPPRNRVTLGYRAINTARQVWMLASGAEKQTALTEALAAESQTPFNRVLKKRGVTKIFTDIAQK